MALLNPPQILPNAAHAIYRYLARRGAEWTTRDDLKRVLVPFSAEYDVIELTSSMCLDVGLLEGSEEKVRIVPVNLTPIEHNDRVNAGFRTLMRRLVLERTLNQDLWREGPRGPSQHGARDFVRAVSWYLSLNIYELSGKYEGDGVTIEALGGREFGADSPIVNAERWQPFVRWSTYLGFATPFSVRGSIMVVPDPAIAIRDVLRRTSERSPVTIESFVGWLASELPVLDQGAYRLEVLSRANRDPDPAGQISPALSHALLRLHDAHLIELESKADAPSLRLVAGSGSFVDYSHVRIGSA